MSLQTYVDSLKPNIVQNGEMAQKVFNYQV